MHLKAERNFQVVHFTYEQLVNVAASVDGGRKVNLHFGLGWDGTPGRLKPCNDLVGVNLLFPLELGWDVAKVFEHNALLVVVVYNFGNACIYPAEFDNISVEGDSRLLHVCLDLEVL